MNFAATIHRLHGLHVGTSVPRHVPDHCPKPRRLLWIASIFAVFLFVSIHGLCLYRIRFHASGCGASLFHIYFLFLDHTLVTEIAEQISKADPGLFCKLHPAIISRLICSDECCAVPVCMEGAEQSRARTFADGQNPALTACRME